MESKEVHDMIGEISKLCAESNDGFFHSVESSNNVLQLMFSFISAAKLTLLKGKKTQEK